MLQDQCQHETHIAACPLGLTHAMARTYGMQVSTIHKDTALNFVDGATHSNTGFFDSTWSCL